MQSQTDLSGLKDKKPELSLLKDIPIGFAKKNLVLPLRIEDGKLVGLVGGPNGRFALRELAYRKGLEPEPIEASPEKVIEEINLAYGQLGSAEDVMDEIQAEDLTSVATEFESPKDILELTTEAPIIRLLNALLQQAVKERASDIHIEPYERELEVRMRTDGLLRTVIRPPKLIQDALITRVKILAGLDIAEKRLPQDGRIRLLVGGRDIDVRVSIVPTVHGERAVLRLLDRSQGLLSLSEVGFEPEQARAFEKALQSSSGIILVTGPTGSGKSTTLYAALNKIYTVEKNIITIEDPVEYQLKGIGQIQVNPRIGLTFASGLRSILRQDPDIIMVGEIRDLETAQIAVQASLTGHLVLSTLHTNDAASAITRLLDMGVEPFLLGSSLVQVLAQRLVRLVCPHCKSFYKPDEKELSYFERAGIEVKELAKGKGCSICKGSGYSGRTAIFEVLTIDRDIRALIREDIASHEIKELAVNKGMKTLQVSGLLKVARGETTLEEVLRVTETVET